MAHALHCDTCSCSNTGWRHIASDRDRSDFQRATTLRILKPGQALYNQGDECSGVFCVRSGLIGLRRIDANGNSALLRLCESEDLLGYRALLTRSPHQNTAEVLTTSRVCFIELSLVHRLLHSIPSLKDFFLQRSLADLGKSEEKCVTLMTQGLKDRFLHLLTMLHQSCGAKSDDRGRVLELPIPRKDLADLLGTTPESISRLIKQLDDDDIVRIVGRQVVFSPAEVSGSHPRFDSTKLSFGADVLSLLMEARKALLRMLECKGVQSRNELNSQIQLASIRLDGLLAKMEVRDGEPGMAFKTVWEQFKVTRQTKIIPEIFRGNVSAAKRIAYGVQAQRLNEMKRIALSGFERSSLQLLQ